MIVYLYKIFIFTFVYFKAFLVISCNEIKFCKTFVKAKMSTSVEDNTTEVCFLTDQVIGQLLNIIIYLETDFPFLASDL